MPPLLQRLSERAPENLDYLGVSYGITPLLFKFWKRSGFVPLYMRQTTNDLTGEHSCVMIRGLNKNMEETGRWLGDFAVGESQFCFFIHSLLRADEENLNSTDFRKRFISLLSFKFREFGSITALSILEAANAGDVSGKTRGEPSIFTHFSILYLSPRFP